METQIFPNILGKIKAENEKSFLDFNEEIKTAGNELYTHWRYKNLLPKGKDVSKWDVETLKAYLIKRKAANLAKELDKDIARLEAIAKAPDFAGCSISVEWKKNKTWGSNPRAEARVSHIDGSENIYESGSIGGCGYDKESTAVARAINQSNSFLKLMYQLREANVNDTLQDIFGYGSGYGLLPYLEGGVGVSCYPNIFKKLGFKFSATARGKSFAVYTVVKITA